MMDGSRDSFSNFLKNNVGAGMVFEEIKSQIVSSLSSRVLVTEKGAWPLMEVFMPFTPQLQFMTSTM